MLAYSLRKYAGVRSYVVPMDLSDSETWGNMDVDWNMQNQVRKRVGLEGRDRASREDAAETIRHVQGGGGGMGAVMYR